MGVAQLVFAFISELAVGVALHSDAVKTANGQIAPTFAFGKAAYRAFRQNDRHSRLRKIGGAVADIAEAYKMNIIALSGHVTDQSARRNFRWAKNLDDLAENADIITFHCPLTKETEKS